MFAQIQNKSFVKLFDNEQLVEWDANNYCTPLALIKDGNADKFGVVPVIVTPAPTVTALQVAVKSGAELVNGNWELVWKVESISENAAKDKRKSAIYGALDLIDQKSIRALREGNAARIAELEAQAVTLRTELAGL